MLPRARSATSPCACPMRLVASQTPHSPRLEVSDVSKHLTSIDDHHRHMSYVHSPISATGSVQHEPGSCLTKISADMQATPARLRLPIHSISWVKQALGAYQGLSHRLLSQKTGYEQAAGRHSTQAFKRTLRCWGNSDSLLHAAAQQLLRRPRPAWIRLLRNQQRTTLIVRLRLVEHTMSCCC